VVKHAALDGTVLDSTIYKYWPQRLLSPPPQDWVGQLKAESNHHPDLIVDTTTPAYSVLTGLPGWAQAVRLVIPTTSTVTVLDRGSSQTKLSYSGVFDPNTGKPNVSLDIVNNTVGEGTLYRHSATVVLFNSTGSPISSRSGLYSNRTNATNLLNSNNPMAQLLTDISSGTAVASSGDSATYAANNVDVVAGYKWGQYTRNANSSLYTTSGEALQPSSTVMDNVSSASPLRSPTGGPQYTVDNTTNITTSYIYEGLRGMPSAVAHNALPNNVAVLTGEDGPGAFGINGTYTGTWGTQSLGVGSWENNNSFVADATMAHTGQYSLKVTGVFGPTRNMTLQNVSSLTNGMTVSAWIYSTGVQPVLSIEQHQGSGTPVGGFSAAPVGGTFVPNTWQQWKIVIPLASLTTANWGGGQTLFGSNANGDFLRIWCGPYPTAGTMWVDDFAIYPTDSKLSIQSYDYAGRLIGSVDPDGHTVTTDYGPKGEVQDVRDERGRVFGQSATISSGEN
jgi:YD repeat-containing protein